jgi:serine/threonine-protein kinase RsbW
MARRHGFPDPDSETVLQVSAEPANLARIREFVEREAVERGADRDAALDIVQAVDESVTNIIEHGYRGGPGVVEVEIGGAPGVVTVRLRDRAPTFDPTGVPSPDLEQPLERRPLGGMGVHLTRELTDEVSHQVPAGWGNELTLLKQLPPAPHGGD